MAHGIFTLDWLDGSADETDILKTGGGGLVGQPDRQFSPPLATAPADLASLISGDTAVATASADMGVSLAGSGGGSGSTTANAAGFALIGTIGNYIAFTSPTSSLGHHFAAGSTVSVNLTGLALAGELLYARTALAAWARVANINFAETTGTAQITMTDDGDATTYNAYTNTSWSSATLLDSADVHITQKWYNNNGGALGTTGILNSYGYQTYLHELGHALGLGHDGPYNGSATYGLTTGTNTNIFTNDSWQFSVMSYFDQTNYGGASLAYVTSAMQADIYGIQLLYGTPSSQTNNKFGYGATAGAVYNLAQSNSFTIYSTTGAADLDASLYTGAQTVNFNAGSFSSIKGLTNNIGLALNTYLTSYEGGLGNDTITLDTLNLDDFVNGNGGTDTVNVGYSYGSGYSILTGSTAANLVMIGAEGHDTLQNIEFVHFADGTTVSTATLLSSAPVGGAKSDFNADGTSDILLQNASTGWLVDWTMKNGALQSWSSLGVQTGWKVMGTGDFNADGTSDILLQDNNGWTVDWTMKNGALQSWSSLGVQTGWKVVGTGDFNADGTTDILLQDNNGWIVDWTMKNGALQSWSSLGVQTGWKVVGTGDYNGDGTSDILLQDNNGWTVDWTMKNGALLSWSSLGVQTGWNAT
jgi:serralysin